MVKLLGWLMVFNELNKVDLNMELCFLIVFSFFLFKMMIVSFGFFWIFEFEVEYVSFKVI